VGTIRFGVFEVDPDSGELRRRGARVSLQEQPFQALLLMLEHAGEVVTREQLTRRLWPADTFVDFERGLNKAINRLREALGDDSDRPGFIETLPRRGYRFIAPIEGLRAPARDGTSMRGPRAASSVPRIDSLAVLPLANHSGDPAQEYFADGMTEELITALATISALRVISRTSVMCYRGTQKTLPSIARDLHVDAVVEGSVARAGEKVRITAQLIHAATDTHLWSGRYERELRDILRLQAEIARDIAGHIHRLLDPASPSPARIREVDPPAYEACLRGVFYRDKMTPMDLGTGIGWFARAIELDPGYAQAHAGLAQACFYMGVFGGGPASELFPKAKAHALRALELDESIAIAHNALASVHVLYEWDWASAEAECLRAVQLAPGDSGPHAHLADYMSIQARHEEAIAEMTRALELDPLSPLHRGFLALLLYRARRYDEAIAECQRALDIDARYPNALWFLALALEQKGRQAEALAQLEKAVTLTSAFHFRALLGRALALLGERTRAEDILADLQAASRREYVSPFDLAVIHCGLGDLTTAFQYLEQAFEQRVFRIIELTMPMFDALRGDRRWHDLVRRIGLPTS
jgi:TolB-like protein/Flp pilus assembly protein TadD